jgi:2-dehydropantoate 2-reductase
MSKIAIIGPGAIGGTLAAWLTQDSRHEVIVAARTPFDQIELATPTGEVLIAKPKVLIRPNEASAVDWVLIATKAYDAAGAAAWLKGFCGSGTEVAVLQNGVEHVERFAPYLPIDQIVPVVIDCPAERTAPGKIHQRRASWMVIPDNDAGRLFAALFAKTPFEMRLSADFKTEAWKKLCFNSAGALSAILLKPSVIARSESIADIMRGIVRECIAVGRAEGAKLDDALVETVITNTRNAPPDSINSIHGDRLAKRPMEIDARNGVIVRLGRKYGLSTPFNAMAVALLEAVQGE